MIASPRAGRLIQQQGGADAFSAFVPNPLPPDPPLEMGPDLLHVLEMAGVALGRLDGVSGLVEPDHLLYMYVRKEAVLSSQIEGTESTLADLLQYEAQDVPGVPLEDVREVSRYVDALRYGTERVREGHPVTLRLIRELHGLLMQEGRGSQQAPGEFRRVQNWIGGPKPSRALFVPPPPNEVLAALDALEKFVNDQPRPTPPLLKAGLAHAQFETIHPFLDGNGRVGRLLITLLLCAAGVLREPFLYLSLYFRQNRADYYEALQRVRTHGEWEQWLRFFLAGVEAVALEATATTRALLELYERDRARVRGLPRGAASALRLYELLRHRVVLSIPRAAAMLEVTQPTVAAAMRRLEELEIVREVTGRGWARQFAYVRQHRILDEGVGW